MTGPAGRPSRADTLLRAREFLRAHGQVPRTEDLSGNPGEAAWALLAQVLDVIAESGEPEAPELAGLAREHPGWRLWRDRGGVYMAWLLQSKPLLLLRSGTVAGLREAIEAETGSGNGN